LPLFVLSFTPSLASADEPSLAELARHRIEERLVKPLGELESHRFSRARPPPRERRVQVPDSAGTLDQNGGLFLRFAIDVRFGAEWHEKDIVGCVYTKSGAIFVKRGDSYRPSEFLLGKNVDPVAGACEAAPARS
jgi:hypothetical protein